MSKEVMFTYWGRRGALSDFMLELGQEVVSNYPATISVSCFNELYHEFQRFDESLFPVSTFDSTFGALTSLGNIFRLRRACFDRFTSDRTRVVINLIPHVWFPAIMPIMKRMRIKHVTVVHDANHHPGDPSGIFTTPLFLRQARAADHAVTLSRYVQEKLVSNSIVPRDRTTTLFHPDLTFRSTPSRRLPNGPLRILFFGRLLPYKRLDLFLDTIELLRARGAAVEAGVLGAGNIRIHTGRLNQLRVHVENRWLSSEELSAKLQDYDVLAICHSEASQSGAVAAAFGAGMPVIAFDVGGIPEQVRNEVTGLIVPKRTASDFADAVIRLVNNPELLKQLMAGVQASMPTRSMKHFVDGLWQIAEEQMLQSSDKFFDILDGSKNIGSSASCYADTVQSM
jgi:glycosyltransferase involved in cell wall biosynthesis